ncbi:MAG: helix-turn-helix transcriptional regulator [Gemmatimonadota bacterium]
MPTPDAAGFLPLHPLEFRILLVLRQGTSWGSRIVAEIEARERSRVTLYPANLYRRVRDLSSRGLIAEAETPPGGDPRRGYMVITPLGARVLSLEAERLQGLVAEAAAEGLLSDA